jgi:flagellar biosynthesis/type III secretory pathway protein FliH
LAERLEEWAHGYEAEGVKKGRQEGMQQGEALALQKLLAKRFGVIPAEITARIASASREQIELWFDRAIEAERMDEVFESGSN